MTNQTNTNVTTRRDFLKHTGRMAAAGALAGLTLPHVHAAENSTVQVALIGCGGRGTGAAANALATKSGPIKLVAMADVFSERLKSSYEGLKNNAPDKVEVPEDRKFIGLEGYKQAMDCLKPGDIAIFTTPPAFRWVHFQYAIQKGLNVFMEKPVTVDGPTSKRMLALGEESVKKNLKVGVGLMVRHCRARRALFERIQQGEIGDIIAMRAYRMHGPVGFFSSERKPANISEMMFQVQRFHSFIWASGGCFSDFYIHQIDECSWMKNAWPVKAQALGGRHYRGTSIDQNFDTYAVEYTYPDGAKLFFNGRTINGCHAEMDSLAHGSKGMAIISKSGHTPGYVSTFKGQTITKAGQTWSFPQPEPDPYQMEWEDLLDAIRNDKPYNEVKRGVEASLVTSMGRMAAHTGQVITYDQMLNCEHEMAPGLDKFTPDSAAPLLAGPDGKYPVPQPGIIKDREY